MTLDHSTKTQQLREELAELQNSLGELDFDDMHAGKAVLSRYIATRITQIVEALCKLGRASAQVQSSGPDRVRRSMEDALPKPLQKVPRKPRSKSRPKSRAKIRLRIKRRFPR